MLLPVAGIRLINGDTSFQYPQSQGHHKALGLLIILLLFYLIPDTANIATVFRDINIETTNSKAI